MPKYKLFIVLQLLSFMAIGRSQEKQLFTDKTFQAGGAAFVSYEKSTGRKLRVGLYVNSDFSRFFIMPLLVADWSMNERNYFLDYYLPVYLGTYIQSFILRRDLIPCHHR